MTTIVLITLGIIALSCLSIWQEKLPSKYSRRICTGRLWKERFPNSSKKEIREFLFLLSEEYAFNRKHALKFAPHDKLNDLFDDLITDKGFVDQMEREDFCEGIAKRYGKNPTNIWHNDITLKEVFRYALHT